MTREQAIKLLEYESNDCHIFIENGYVDRDFILGVNDKEEICYSSHVYNEEPLSEVNVEDVAVSKRIEDWYDKNPKEL